MKTKIIFLSFFLLITVFAQAQAPLYTSVPVSISGSDNTIGAASSSRNVTVDAAGSIYAVFSNTDGIKVAKSTNRGQSFTAPVLVSTTVSNSMEIAVSSNGTVYVLWENGFAYSSNGGSIFTTSTSFFGAGSSASHIATNGANVYVISQSGNVVYSNSTNGVGVFTSNFSGVGNAFSDIFVDSSTGTIYLVGDTPNVTLYKSLDNAVTFSQINFSQPVSAYYSSYAYSSGSLGKFIFVGGSDLGGTSGTDGYRINLENGNVTSSLLMQNSTAEERTLIADQYGNFVDGYKNSGSLDFRISYNQGVTWQPAITGVTGTSQNLVRNQVFQDVVVLYSQNGQIFCNVYGSILPGLTLGETNVIASQCGFTMPSNSTIVYANLVSGAQAYRFRVTDLSTNVAVVKDYALRNLYMSSLTNFKYNQTYSVEVSVKKAGVFGPYGSSCTITTPNALTQLRAADCGAVKQRNDIVYADLISLAQGYRFKVVNLNTGSEQIIDRSLRSLYLTSITDYSPIALSRGIISAANSYNISVAVKNTDGTYLDYGSSCYVEISSGSSSAVARGIDQAETETFDAFKAVGYPNPFDNSFKLELNSNSTSKVSIVIYDMIGKQVENREISASDVNNIEIGQRLTTGIYNVVLSQDGNTQTLRMAKR